MLFFQFLASEPGKLPSWKLKKRCQSRRWTSLWGATVFEWRLSQREAEVDGWTTLFPCIKLGCISWAFGLHREDTITTVATFFLQTVVPQKGQKFYLDTLVSQCIYECNVQTRVSKFYESSVLTPLVDYPFEVENEYLVGNCLSMYVNIPPRLMLLNKYCMNSCYSTLEMKGYNYR